MVLKRDKITIRRANHNDEPEIKACAEAAYDCYVAAIGRKPAPMVADFEHHIAMGEAFVAVEQDDLLGFIVYYPKAQRMFLENVAVNPKWQGQGVGFALIESCEISAKSKELKSVVLNTNAKMIENLTLYPRLGYQETARIYEDGFDRVYFEKAL